jgi:two-component system, NtrC family, sensor kinase
MKRTLLVVILAAAALGLLVSVALESRSVPVGVHIAQQAVTAEVERVNEDFGTLLSTLSSAWEATQSPGDCARVLTARLAASPQRLTAPVGQISGSASQRLRIENSLASFSKAATEAATLAEQLAAEQSSYAGAVTYLRDIGPRIIEQMRDIRLDQIAADTFQLIVGTVDFATPASGIQEYELRRLLVTLGRDPQVDANLPTEVQRLRASVATILDNKRDIISKLDQLAATPVVASAAGVDYAVQDAYISGVANVDRARLMLAIYAVVLLAAVGFVAFRLQGSYREINRANQNLASLNESLEQRVVERTEALAGTLADLKESQVQLVQAEKMSSLGQLVAGISHEINTPLLYLANNAALIQERIELMNRFVKDCTAAFSLKAENFAERSEFQTKFVASLRDLKLMLRDEELEAVLEEAADLARDSIEGLDDLTQMAQSLKDFSRLDRAPVGSFDVNSGLDKTLVIARNIVKHKADVRKYYGDVPEVECSPSQINQVFLNLITNAAQAIEDHGEIAITTKRHDDDHVAVTITDTGCGIPEENLARIRDPFFTTKEVGSGTGLGLSIVDEIVRSHGGELWVESVVGKGSAFTVVLPIKQKRPSRHRASGEDDADDVAPDDPQEFAQAV